MLANVTVKRKGEEGCATREKRVKPRFVNTAKRRAKNLC